MDEFYRGMWDALEKQAGAVDLYIVGPPGSGKTTMANKHCKTHTVIHLDDYLKRDPKTNRTRGYDWAKVRALVRKSKKPVVIEGVYGNKGLSRGAKKIMLNPGKWTSIFRRTKRHLTGEEKRSYWGKDDPVSAFKMHKLWRDNWKPHNLKLGFEKKASSVLRRLSSVRKVQDGFELLLDGKKIGNIRIVNGQTKNVLIDKKYQGMGLGKKLYGEVLRRMPGGKLKSDTIMSPVAARIWEGMARRKGYTVKMNPKTKKFGAGGMTTHRLVNGAAHASPGSPPVATARITRKARIQS